MPGGPGVEALAGYCSPG